MDAAEAVRALQARGLKPRAAIRMVGYAAFLRQVGWNGLAELMDPESLGMLRSGFEDAGVNPLAIEFPNGDALYLEELRRSSYHPLVREAVEGNRHSGN